jgi:hypothetical protein
MPSDNRYQPPMPPPDWRPEAPPQTRSSRSRVRAVAITLAGVAAVGTGALVLDLGASHASSTTASSSSTSDASTTSGTSSSGLSSVQAPGSTSGSSTAQASSGGS